MANDAEQALLRRDVIFVQPIPALRPDDIACAEVRLQSVELSGWYAGGQAAAGRNGRQAAR